MNPIIIGYARLVKVGIKSIEDVPEKYRQDVIELIS